MADTLVSLFTTRWKLFGIVERLITINVIVFVVLFTLKLIGSWFNIGAINIAENSSFYLATTSNWRVLLTRPWTIITHMFVHAGVMHILFNMVFLYFVGRMFVGFFGNKKLLSTYLLGGISGFLLFFIAGQFLPGAGGFAVGASAAVMAIFIALATYFPDMEIRLFLFGNVKLKYVALIYILIDYLSLGGGNVGGHIGHLGGAAYGFLLMYNMKHGRDISAWFERILDRIANLFKGGGMKVVHRSKPKKRVVSDDEYNTQKLDNQKRIDRILDKISKGGWDSLSKDEKEFLGKHGRDV